MKIDKKRYPFIGYIERDLLIKKGKSTVDKLFGGVSTELLSNQMGFTAKASFNSIMNRIETNEYKNHKIVADTVVHEFITTKLYLKTITLLKDLPDGIAGVLHFKYQDTQGTKFNTSAVYNIVEGQLKAFFFIPKEGKYKGLFEGSGESPTLHGGKFMFGALLPLENIKVDLDNPSELDNNLMGILAALLLYVEFGEKKIVVLDEKTGKKKKSEFSGDKFMSEFKIPIQVIDSGYFKKIVYSKGITVGAYWRNQPYGKGMSERKLKLIGAYERKGYNTHLLEKENK